MEQLGSFMRWSLCSLSCFFSYFNPEGNIETDKQGDCHSPSRSVPEWHESRNTTILHADEYAFVSALLVFFSLPRIHMFFGFFFCLSIIRCGHNVSFWVFASPTCLIFKAKLGRFTQQNGCKSISSHEFSINNSTK